MSRAERILQEVMPPEVRLKELTKRSNNITVNFNYPPARYFRSGNEMIRMAKVYLDEQSYEQAFELFMKFMTLFLEKIRDHPDFKKVPPDMIVNNTKILKEVIPVAEKLKEKLLKLFTDEYHKFLEEKKRIEEEEELARKREQELLLSRKRIEHKHSKDTKNHRIVAEDENIKSVIKPVPHLPDDSFIYNTSTLDPNRIPSQSIPSVKPGIDRSTKPVSNNYSAQSSTQSSLRTVIVPSKMIQNFLVLSQKNTNSDIETCGILAGKLSHNMLIVTHLLIPKQYGTANSCSTDNEEEIFAYQDEQNLITLGWIHTHPSQTAFLSSVDLHTHCSYQLMMAEAIAIVCSPRYNQTGFFYLTPDYGLDYISNCRETGFHPHPSEPPLFTEAKHCELDDSTDVEILDLRR